MKARSWVLASSNAGKLAEFRSLLDRDEITPQSQFDIAPAAETAATFVENALLKARHVSRLTQRSALADDSGLVVNALAGAPGVHSARFAGESSTDAQNIAKLLGALKNIPSERRSAHFYCAVVAIANADDPAPLVALGRWDGSIATEPRGTNGFGYDPVFIDADSSLTAAELSPQEKNRLSHRAQALERLREMLSGYDN